MSSYVWMRVLESAPKRYDLGIRLLSRGHIQRIYDRVAELAHGRDVLDVGCGTGNLALRLSQRGMRATGVDISPGMLAVARSKTPEESSVEWVETSAVELTDHFAPNTFDSIVSLLLFSELSEDEQKLVLAQCWSLLRPGGRLILADEVRSEGLFRQMLHLLLRFPLAVITYALTQTTTTQVRAIASKLKEAGFTIILEEKNRLGDFAVIAAEKGESRHACRA